MSDIDYILELENLKIAIERHKEEFPSDIKTIKEMHDRINELEKIVWGENNDNN